MVASDPLLAKAATPSTQTTWADIAALPQPAADAVIPYGTAASQFGELRLPKGKGPYPVVVLVHGGCWLADFSLDHVRNLAAAITALGFATWSLEYRRLGEPGGGWPGTFLDVASGVDHLRKLNVIYKNNLDLGRVLVLGHSAGGHLALWAASRPQLPANSALFRPDPLPIHAVVGLAAISDLAAYSAGAGDCNAATRALLGGTPQQVPTRYQEALPPLAPATHAFLVHGTDDAIVPFEQSVHYTAKSAATKLFKVPGAGHFDLISPQSPSWQTVSAAIKEAAKP